MYHRISTGRVIESAKTNASTSKRKNSNATLNSMSARLAFLKENSEAIKAIAARHKGLKIAVFGSVARGDDGPDSDVDFLVTFDKGTSLLDLLGLQDALEEFLKVSVDVISIGGLKTRDHQIREEALTL